jgi:hypothetical protein
MPNWKDNWKTIHQTESEWLRIKKDGTDPTLEVAYEIGTYEDSEGVEQRKFLLFVFDVERFKLVSDPKNHRVIYLVSEGYDPSWPHPLEKYEVWFAKDLEQVAKSTGVDPLELATMFTSKDPKVRARAYMDVGGYHGFQNFDERNHQINEPELDERWG